MHSQYSALLALLALVLFCGVNTQPAEEIAPKFIANPTSLIFMNDTYYYIESSVQKNWFNALAACKKMGYQLVSLQTEDKYNMVVEFLVSSGQSQYFWTSGNDLYTLGKHQWYPSNVAVLASEWGAKQPDNSGGVEHCDELFKKNNNYTLQDDNCNVARNYICEMPAP